MEHTESRSIKTLVARAAVPLAIACVIAVGGAITARVAPTGPQAKHDGQQRTTAATDVARPAAERGGAVPAARCATCGTVESVQAVDQSGYRVRVRMDDGSQRTFSQPIAPGYEVGEKVRIIEGADASRG